MSLSPLNLQGKRILVTRPIEQAAHLIKLIEQHGGQAIALPTLEICPIAAPETIKQRLENLKAYQWLIFISANAVNFAVATNNGKIPAFAELKIAAVGKATAQALQNLGIQVDLIPDSGFNSEALLATNALQQVQKQRILIVRGVGGRETLAQALQARGALVDYLEVYQRKMPVIDAKATAVLALLTQRHIDIITITSAEALQNLVSLLKTHQALLVKIPLVVMSERIKPIAQASGFKTIVVSSSPDDVAILNTMIMLINGEDSGRRTN